MKLTIYMILILSFLSIKNPVHSQSPAPIDFDIRGRDCSGGLGFCSANKTSYPNNNVVVQKTGMNTFVLTILRSSLTENEEASIAGQSFSALQSNLPNNFIQSGDLQFNAEVVQALEIDPKYNLLKKSSYPMTIDKYIVKITLTLIAGDKD